MKKVINFAAWAIPVLLLAWFAYTLIQNTKTQLQEKSQEIQITVNFNNKPVEGTETVETTRQVPVTCPFSGETKTSEVKTVVKTTKAEPSERRVVITEDAFKETMQQVAYTARQEAQNEYDKNFTTLLTILTIFGIAWPLVIAYLQYRINKSDLRKIRKALKQSKKIKIMLDEFKQKAYCEIADAAHLNAIFWEEDMVNGKDKITRDNGLRCHVRALIKSIYYYALAGKTGRANSKVKTAITRLKEMNDWPPEKQSFVINEIDWGLFTNNDLGIEQADTIQGLVNKVFCKPRPNED